MDGTGQRGRSLMTSKGLVCYVNELVFYPIRTRRNTEDFYRTEKTSLV